jgi:hypothetical protein
MTIRRRFTGAIHTTPVTKAAVRAPIGPQGGTLTARHAAVTFTLTVPPGALAARTTIAMTPIAAIRGLPLSGRAAAVRFGPERVTFATPATLTIRGVRGKLIGFTAAGRGARLAFVRARSTGNRAVVAIAHFSTAGAGADAADFAAVVAPLISGLGPLTEGEVETLVGEIGLWQERFGPTFCETQPVCKQALDTSRSPPRTCRSRPAPSSSSRPRSPAGSIRA